MALGGVQKARQTVGAQLGMLPALLVVGFAAAFVVGVPAVAHAHGAEVEYARDAEAVQVTAAFDNGEPMSGAQVVVYPPGDEPDPWARGTTDQQGRFFFVPDASKTGSWDVEVQQAGHGDTIEVPVQPAGTGTPGATEEGAAATEEEAASGAGHGDAADAGHGAAADAAVVGEQATGQGETGFGPLQIALMAALGVWGLVGTALFFARRKPA